MGPAPKGSWTEVVYFGSTAPWAFELGKFNPLENPGKMGRNLESKMAWKILGLVKCCK